MKIKNRDITLLVAVYSIFFLICNSIIALPSYYITGITYSCNETIDFSPDMIMSSSMSQFELTFGLIQSGFDNESITEAEVKIYPNPFNRSATIKYSLSNESDVNIIIYDLYGNKIKTIEDQTHLSGSHTIEWTAQDVSQGTYYVKISINNELYVKRIVLMR